MAAMRGTLAAAAMIAWVGCTGMDPTPEAPVPAKELVADAQGCHEVVTLAGDVAPHDAVLGPYRFGTGRFCLHLDASALYRGHFMASTEAVAGTTSPFTMTLTAPDGTVLDEGWPLTIGEAEPWTFTSYEMAIEGGTTRDLVLVVAAPAEAATEIGISLFDPLE